MDEIESWGSFSSSVWTLYDSKRPRATKTQTGNQSKNCGPQFWLQGSFSARTLLHMVQFFSQFRGLSYSKLAQICTERDQQLVQGFHLLKDHIYSQ
jgi:hypothetical protein